MRDLLENLALTSEQSIFGSHFHSSGIQEMSDTDDNSVVKDGESMRDAESSDASSEVHISLETSPYDIWKENSQYLYDLLLYNHVSWPSVTCTWGRVINEDSLNSISPLSQVFYYSSHTGIRLFARLFARRRLSQRDEVVGEQSGDDRRGFRGDDASSRNPVVVFGQIQRRPAEPQLCVHEAPRPPGWRGSSEVRARFVRLGLGSFPFPIGWCPTQTIRASICGSCLFSTITLSVTVATLLLRI